MDDDDKATQGMPLGDDGQPIDDFQQNNPDDVNPMQQMTDDEELPEDHDTPFSPPSGMQDRIDSTFPENDTDMEPSEIYNSGREEATGDLPGQTANERDEPPETEDKTSW